MPPHEDGVHFSIPEEVIGELVRRAAALVLSELKLAENRSAAKYVSPADAAAYIGKSRQRIYDLLAMGDLTKYQDGTSVLISVQELEAYLHGEPTGRRTR